MLFGLHGRRGRAVVFAFLVAISRAEVSAPIAAAPKPSPDSRIDSIRQFFVERRSPLHRYSRDFVRIADQHRLDWRLLPSLAVAESSGGLHYRNNNVFGWNNGKAKFKSVSHGISVVAQRLAHAPIYRSKTIEQKLFVYNPKRAYVKAILNLMASIQKPDLAFTRVSP